MNAGAEEKHALVLRQPYHGRLTKVMMGAPGCATRLSIILSTGLWLVAGLPRPEILRGCVSVTVAAR